jgi:hypothetical protein
LLLGVAFLGSIGYFNASFSAVLVFLKLFFFDLSPMFHEISIPLLDELSSELAENDDAYLMCLD